MSIIKDLEKDIKKIVKEAGYDVDKLSMEPSNRRDLGEYQLNDAMQLAKAYHENPRVIAEKIVKELSKDKRFENINIAGPGFINFSLQLEYCYEILNKMQKDLFSNIDKRENKKVILDYGGANVAKSLHVGHLRSANIGEALKRLANTMGYEAIGDAHLGDYGRPLGLVINEIKRQYPILPYFDENYNGSYENLDLPITNEDLEKIYPIASQKAKEDEKDLEESRTITAKIQQKEKGYYDLWKKIVEISKEDIKNTYSKLNVNFEIWNGESDEMEYFDELYKICQERNILQQSEGAQIIDISKEDDKSPIPPLLFIKSNNSVSYETTDLATILERIKNYNPDEIWYVVDARQELHFEQVFRASKKIGIIDDKTKLEYIGFGTMNGQDGKPFKTRDGGVMTLKKLIDLVKVETKKKITNESIKEEEKESISNDVAIATIKYADLLPFRNTDYVFEIDKFSDLEGKTGPYLLYSTIRMRSLINKANINNLKPVSKLIGEKEKDIILTLLNLPFILDKALDTKSLNEIAEYLFKLTSAYNKFYAENRILTEKDEQLRDSWITLTEIVYRLNCLLLDILGITIPNKM